MKTTPEIRQALYKDDDEAAQIRLDKIGACESRFAGMDRPNSFWTTER